MIRIINAGNKQASISKAIELGLLDATTGKEKKSRERDELEEKLTDLGITIPW
jgi:thymidylate synthase (FAD)